MKGKPTVKQVQRWSTSHDHRVRVLSCLPYIPLDSSSLFVTRPCWNLALPGSPKRKQIGRGAVREAALRAARSRADPSHRVQGALQRVQGRAPETGALRTHGQWTDLFYIHTDTFFIFDISSYTDVELTPYGLLLLTLSFHLTHGRFIRKT